MIPVYSNAYLRVDLNPSYAQIQQRKGCNYTLENPYRPEVDGEIQVDPSIAMLSTANHMFVG